MSPARQRKRRNVNPELATLRARLASMTRNGASPDQIGAVRAELRAAKARAVVGELLPLPAAERTALAVMLLTGGGGDVAA